MGGVGGTLCTHLQWSTELMFSWLRFTLSISGVYMTGVPFAELSLYNT